MPITLPPDLLLFGNATPESNRQARIGSLFQRLDSGTFPLYVKTTTGAKTGWRPVMVAPATGGFTAGSVVFAGSGGQLAQDNANLFWDDTNNRLGIGTASPGEPLHVVGDARITEGLSVGSGASPVGQNGRIYLRGNSTGTIEVSDGSGTYGQLVLLTNNIAGWVDTGSGLAQKLWLNNTGLGIGVSPTYALDVLGSTNFVGTAKISSWFGQDKTNYRGVFLGYDTSGQIGIIAADTVSAASSLAFWTYSGSAWAERARINSTGLGIGVTPGAAVTTAGSVGAARIGLGVIKGVGGLFLGTNESSPPFTSTAYFGLQTSPTGFTNDFALIGSSDSTTKRYLRFGYNTSDNPSSSFNSKIAMNLYDGSIIVGSPTGGDKGAGTINAVAVYDDNVLLTDYVFEPEYKLLPLDNWASYFRRDKHLPTIPGRDEWEKSGKFSLGKLGSHLWETVEVLALYIDQLHNRLKALES